MNRAHLAVLLAAALAASATPARAAEPEEVKRADELFREGQRLLKAGRVTEACSAFAQSQLFDPAVGTLLNLAECHAQERRFASARAEFLEAARLAKESGQREREAFALEQAAASEAVLSLVEIHLPAAIDAVLVDDKPIDKKLLAKPLPLDPGPHALSFKAAGHVQRAMHIDVANGPSSQVVDVAPLEPIAPAASVESPHPTEDRERPRRIAGLAAAGVGVIAVGIGTIFGISAAGKKSDAEPHCNGKFCDPEGLSLQDDAHSAATVSTIAFLVGVVGIGAGAYLYFSVPRPAKGIARARIVPTASGMRLEATW